MPTKFWLNIYVIRAIEIISEIFSEIHFLFLERIISISHRHSVAAVKNCTEKFFVELRSLGFFLKLCKFIDTCKWEKVNEADVFKSCLLRRKSILNAEVRTPHDKLF